MQKVLILSSVWCEPQSSAAGIHLFQIIEFLKSKNLELIYASTSAFSENRIDLTTIGVEEIQIQLNDSAFDLWIKQISPDLVIFDRFLIEEQFAWRVRENCPDALLVLNTEDLHSLRKSRQASFKENVTFNLDYWKAQEITKRELASIYRSDITLLVSEVEIKHLIEDFSVPEYLLDYLPIKAELKANLSFEERNHFYTIGNFIHEPNYDGLKWLKEEIWPIIKNALPQAEFHAYGSYPNHKAQSLQDKTQGFFIKGSLKDLESTLPTYKICLAPLRFGAGIKGKFIEAMRFGTPSVTTSIGVEGICEEVNWAGTIGNESSEIAKKAIELYSNQDFWTQKQKLGNELINNKFSDNRYLEAFYQTMIEAKNNLIQRRTQNHVGAILIQNQYNSTKYFSKWIEEKNKV